MRIERNHTLGRDEARRRVESVADSLAGKYGLQCEWSGDDLSVSGKGMDGVIAITDDQVCVDAKLGFALKMLEGTIQSSIEEALDEHLA